MVIIDDDEIIREGLTRNIAWEDHDVELAGSAKNGLEGLELIKTVQPQVILSDIHMPFMNGLEMAESLKSIYPGAKVVFLTGYDDFKYVKQALNLKVTDYILKYSENDDILKAVCKAGKEWLEENELHMKAEKGETYLKEKILTKCILSNQNPTPDEISVLGFGENNRFCVVIIRCDVPAQSRDNQERLLEVCRTFLGEPAGRQEYIVINSDIALVLRYEPSGESPSEALKQQLNRLLEKLQEQWPGPIRMGAGETYPGFEALGRSYQEALLAITSQGKDCPAQATFFGELGETENHCRFQKIIGYIKQNFADPELSLATVAEKINICPAYISTIFKRYQHQNFSDYLISLRMENAREMLAKTNLLTYEVAEKCGYTNPQYFSQLFKKYTGYTPTEYKSKHDLADEKPL